MAHRASLKMVLRIIFAFLIVISFSGFSLTVLEKTAIVENVYKKIYSAMGLAENRPKLIFDTKTLGR